MLLWVCTFVCNVQMWWCGCEWRINCNGALSGRNYLPLGSSDLLESYEPSKSTTCCTTLEVPFWWVQAFWKVTQMRLDRDNLLNLLLLSCRTHYLQAVKLYFESSFASRAAAIPAHKHLCQTTAVRYNERRYAKLCDATGTCANTLATDRSTTHTETTHSSITHDRSSIRGHSNSITFTVLLTFGTLSPWARWAGHRTHQQHIRSKVVPSQ